MRLLSVNVGRPAPLPSAGGPAGCCSRSTSSHSRGPCALSDPGPKGTGGSGLAGDAVCDLRNHGGGDQAVYAFAQEELDAWERQLGGRELANGSFGENLTTLGVDVGQDVIGERWRVGAELLLEVTSARSCGSPTTAPRTTPRTPPGCWRPGPRGCCWRRAGQKPSTPRATATGSRGCRSRRCWWSGKGSRAVRWRVLTGSAPTTLTGSCSPYGIWCGWGTGRRWCGADGQPHRPGGTRRLRAGAGDPGPGRDRTAGRRRLRRPRPRLLSGRRWPCGTRCARGGRVRC
ncbi:hypothetical protein SMICM17S_10504 [Streptomyces microflavus]